MLQRVLYIFSIFRPICEYLASKNLPLMRTIHRAIFSHLRTHHSAARQMRDTLMQTNGNHKESSLVTKAYGGRISQLSVFNVSRTGFVVCDEAL